jgi:hypothetical protein
MKRLLMAVLSNKQFDEYLLGLMEEETPWGTKISLRACPLIIYRATNEAYISDGRNAHGYLLKRSYDEYSALLKARKPKDEPQC